MVGLRAMLKIRRVLNCWLELHRDFGLASEEPKNVDGPLCMWAATGDLDNFSEETNEPVINAQLVLQYPSKTVRFQTITAVLALLLIAGAGCYYDVEEDLTTGQPCMTKDRSYRDHILPILENRCYKCHSADTNLGNITLEGYDAVKRYVDNQRLLGTIRHESGFAPMPLNETMLPPCQISTISAWIDDGALNN